MTVVIGSQTDVPATGDPIVSPWYQDTARKLVHQFASVAARNAWTTRPEGAMAWTADENRIAVWTGAAWSYLQHEGLAVLKAGDVMSGNLQVGGPATTPNAGAGLRVTGQVDSTLNISAPNMILWRYTVSAFVVGHRYIRLNASDGTEIGSVSIASGSSVAFNTTSDPRLKERTGDADDALDVVAELGAHVYRGRWIADDGQGQEWIFLNSTDVEAVAPYAVSGDADATDDDGNIIAQQLDHGSLVPLLIAAVSQLTARVAALEAAAA